LGVAISLSISGLDWPWSALLCAVWSMDCVRGLTYVHSSKCRLTGIRVTADGMIELLGQDADCKPAGSAQLLAGSVVGSHFAWLKLAAADGTRHALFFRAADDPFAWHRLALLWQLSRSGLVAASDS